MQPLVDEEKIKKRFERNFNSRKGHVQSVLLKSDWQPILRSKILTVKDFAKHGSTV